MAVNKYLFYHRGLTVYLKIQQYTYFNAKQKAYSDQKRAFFFVKIVPWAPLFFSIATFSVDKIVSNRT